MNMVSLDFIKENWLAKATLYRRYLLSFMADSALVSVLLTWAIIFKALDDLPLEPTQFVVTAVYIYLVYTFSASTYLMFHVSVEINKLRTLEGGGYDDTFIKPIISHIKSLGGDSMYLTCSKTDQLKEVELTKYRAFCRMLKGG